jgi:hypothetical protein
MASAYFLLHIPLQAAAALSRIRQEASEASEV